MSLCVIVLVDDSPVNKSTWWFVVAFDTLIWTTILPSSREISSVPSSRLLKRRSPSGFHVRNWKPTDNVWWLARPGSCRKLVALKKTGKVWVSTQEKDRLRCWDLEREGWQEVINCSSDREVGNWGYVHDNLREVCAQRENKHSCGISALIVIELLQPCALHQIISERRISSCRTNCRRFLIASPCTSVCVHVCVFPEFERGSGLIRNEWLCESSEGIRGAGYNELD